MKQFTEAEVATIGKTVHGAVRGSGHTVCSEEFYAAIGRAAVAAVAPLLLAKPDADEARTALALEAGGNGAPFAIRNLLANRLASLTAKPDERFEVVCAVLRENDGTVPNVAAAIIKALDQKAGRA